jgi:hypothetical protein
MTDGKRVEMLAAECRTFTRYLIGIDAPSDVVRHYQRAHEVSVVEAGGVVPPLDRALLRVARLGPSFARACDGYAGAFARTSLLRRKLVLLTAIFESRQQTAVIFDSAVPGSRAAWVVEVSARAGISALIGCLAALVILPLGLWYRVVDADRRRRGDIFSRSR